jgi:hypothetical protein
MLGAPSRARRLAPSSARGFPELRVAYFERNFNCNSNFNSNCNSNFNTHERRKGTPEPPACPSAETETARSD